jgi:hypothetical protein
MSAVRLRAGWRLLGSRGSARRHVYSLTAVDQPGVVIGVTKAKEENSNEFALTESGRYHHRYCPLPTQLRKLYFSPHTIIQFLLPVYSFCCYLLRYLTLFYLFY